MSLTILSAIYAGRLDSYIPTWARAVLSRCGGRRKLANSRTV